MHCVPYCFISCSHAIENPRIREVSQGAHKQKSDKLHCVIITSKTHCRCKSYLEKLAARVQLPGAATLHCTIVAHSQQAAVAGICAVPIEIKGLLKVNHHVETLGFAGRDGDEERSVSWGVHCCSRSRRTRRTCQG